MEQIILIATTPKRHRFLQNFLTSMEGYSGEYPLFIYSSYKRNKMEDIIYNTSVKEVLFLHDSIEMKNFLLFDLCFKENKGKSVSFNNNKSFNVDRYFLMGIGKFKTEVLRKINIPIWRNLKDEAEWEHKFGNIYVKASGEEPVTILPDEEIFDTNIFIDKFGRKNMVIENRFFIKYKGHWSYDMCVNSNNDNG